MFGIMRGVVNMEANILSHTLHVKDQSVPDNGRGAKISEQEKKLLEISTDFSGLFHYWVHLISS